MEARKRTILGTVVQRYVETGQPVSSAYVASTTSSQVSSATVRKEMNGLEREGYLTQPHTSAGRIPTERGYRFFVDAMVDNGELGIADRQRIGAFFDRATVALDDLLRETSSLVSHLTSFAAVVSGPSADSASVRALHPVWLHANTFMVVLVLSNGIVQKLTVDIDPARLGVDAVDEQTAADLIAHATAAFAPAIGQRIAVAAGSVAGTEHPFVEQIRTAMSDHIALTHQPTVFIEGAGQLVTGSPSGLESSSFRQLVRVLEDQMAVIGLIQDVLDRGRRVAIGAEHEIDELRECSVVAAPYVIEGEVAGTVGVIGPTRMDYARMLAAVAAVSDRLGHRLSGPSQPL
ncbi:MAG: heat-inducible transcription repressor HrcA [Actinobacteria bacterium]|nr:heat-inducible transcription repressor HrcA [Actinomycetota bacterium]MCB9388462.1 heat-inducible transcription repressor HrcA [Acidimicrobiia bacterium]